MSLSALPQLQVTVASTDMFTLAASYLGDATQWNRIASANHYLNSDGFVDPFIDIVAQLTIPPIDPSRGNGGILGG